MKQMTMCNEISSGATTATLKAVILYDDFNLAVHATRLLEQAALSFDGPMRWDVAPWRLDLLRHPALGPQAMAEAAGADLIVLAVKAAEAAQEGALAWLESWTQRRNDQDAAVMIFCPDETAGSARLTSELKWFTVRQGLSFLDGIGGRRATNPGRQSYDRVDPPTVGVAARSSIPFHWGLAE